MTRRTAVLVALLIAALLLGLGTSAMVGLADEESDNTPSPIPRSFYGTVSIDDKSAPEGTELVAMVDGEERGSITVDDDGTYGGLSGFDDRLVVQGTSADENVTITFLVDGEEADQTATWVAETTTELDITIEAASGPSAGGGPVNVGSEERDDGDGRETDDDHDLEEEDDNGERDDERQPTEEYDDRAEDSEEDADSVGENEEGEESDDSANDIGDRLPGFGVAISIITIFGVVLWTTRSKSET